MNVAGAQNTLNTDVIEGEFTAEADSDVGSGDIPVPDDLLTEGEASARYPLPEALVKTEYEIVLTRSAPQNNGLVVYDPGIAERILIASRLTDTTDWAYYQQVAESFGGLYPGRIAHIRDLLDRLRDTLEDLRRVQRQAEQERLNLNARNNFINERIETDLKELRENWEKQREALRVSIRETEEKRIAYRMSRQPEVDAERKRYYETKEKWNRERDERQKTDEERRWLESEENRRSDRERATERAAAQSKEYSDAWLTATEAERIAQDADAAAYEAAQEAAGRLQKEIEATDAAYDEAFRDVLARLEQDEATLREAAHPIEQDLLTDKRERETELHRAELSTHEAQTEREKQRNEERVRAERAVAAAGLMPDATEADNGLHGSVIKRFPGELVMSQANIGHLAFPEKGGWLIWFSDALRSFAKFVALVSFGSIFGVSLGLLTGLADFTQEALQRSGNLILNLVLLCIPSIFVFYLMGRAVHNAWVYAEEERCAAKTSSNSIGYGHYLMAAALATVMVVFFTGIEATVEKYGIVDGVMQQQKENPTPGASNQGKEMAYWTIALVVSVPFLLYHSYAGAMEARYRLGAQSREHELARLREDAIKAPEVIAACEAQGILQAAHDRLSNTEDDFAALLSEKKRRIAEIETELTDHPALRRLRNFEQNRLILLHNAPELIKAAEGRDAVRDLLENDAALKAAEDRAAALRQQADATRQSAEALRHGNYSAAHSAQMVASPASNVAETSANAMSAAPKWEEMEALERWRSVRQAIFNDPQIHFYRNRVKALQSGIRSLDDNYRKRKKELADQKRAVHIGPQPVDPAMVWQVQEALTRVEAVQIAVDEETLRLVQLTDGPALIRWFHSVRQHLFSRSPMRQRIEASKRLRALPSAPASSERS